jgi:hypothetical protein
MDLGDWLRSLGLERYEAAFRENEINEKVLPSLTAEDLKELGVNALGHRRMLLDAIAALRGNTQASLPEAPQAVDTHSPPAWIRRTYARSFLLIRNASPRRRAASAGSWRNIWATACWYISAIRRPTRTMLSAQYGLGWS